MEIFSLVENNVNHMCDKLFGDKDPNLKLITKMNLMFDGSYERENEIKETLVKIKQINHYEAQGIENELFLTYDCCGNLVEKIGIQ